MNLMLCIGGGGGGRPGCDIVKLGVGGYISGSFLFIFLYETKKGSK